MTQTSLSTSMALRELLTTSGKDARLRATLASFHVPGWSCPDPAGNGPAVSQCAPPQASFRQLPCTLPAGWAPACPEGLLGSLLAHISQEPCHQGLPEVFPCMRASMTLLQLPGIHSNLDIPVPVHISLLTCRTWLSHQDTWWCETLLKWLLSDSCGRCLPAGVLQLPGISCEAPSPHCLCVMPVTLACPQDIAMAVKCICKVLSHGVVCSTLFHPGACRLFKALVREGVHGLPVQCPGASAGCLDLAGTCTHAHASA